MNDKNSLISTKITDTKGIYTFDGQYRNWKYIYP